MHAYDCKNYCNLLTYLQGHQKILLKHSVLRADKIDESRRVFKTKVQWHHISNITTYECPLGIDQCTKQNMMMILKVDIQRPIYKFTNLKISEQVGA